MLCDESTGGCDTLISCQRWRMYGVAWDGLVGVPKCIMMIGNEHFSYKGFVTDAQLEKVDLL